ncbi:UNVERIFIED_CONTAM: hypothetical protein Scaly_0985200 [Sesamum calycinum]|uniref:Reverse transcriptase domain-containing protein n=1 Tax=Sesamum calycinum TaxID=2727403 RepID=A0AAW2QZE6_9LAMI
MPRLDLGPGPSFQRVLVQGGEIVIKWPMTIWETQLTSLSLNLGWLKPLSPLGSPTYYPTRSTNSTWKGKSIDNFDIQEIWLKGGDQCSKVFFRRVATRRANKRVLQISDDDGNEQTYPTIISSIFVDFFQGLLGGARTERVLDLQYLRPWGIFGILTTFFDIEEDKAPGPDGFFSGFFKAAWPIVGEEVSKAIIDFFTTGCLLKQLNATLLTLIPKVRTPHSVADFRPISCCNVIYKVITKILVSRIREILDLLISPSQNAFVPGRLISDNVLLAQELFYGYNQCWWIEECVTTAHYSVVVNGGVHGFFVGALGLR